MRQFAITIIILGILSKTLGLFSVVTSPPEIEKGIIEYTEEKKLQTSCTMQLACPTSYEELSTCDEHIHDTYYINEDDNDDSSIHTTCEMKFKVNAIPEDINLIDEKNLCPSEEHFVDSALLPHPYNCSLFYKCDWGIPVRFECPEELHFNRILQVCDWPWQAGCDSSWIGCPRPIPHCPTNYPKPLFLPHPHLCDRFYLCNWGVPQIQACPTGLHFNFRLNVCDWPYNSNCLVC